MISKTSNKQQDKRVISALLPLVPFLDVYELPIAPISFGEILLICIIVHSLRNKVLTLKKTSYVLFLLYALIDSLALGLLFDSIVISIWFFRWARIAILAYMFLVISPQYAIGEYIEESFRIVSLVASIFQIVQTLVWRLLGVALVPLIPYLRLHYSISNYNEYIAHILRWNGAVWRPSNFFLEPAQFAQFAVLALLVILVLPKNALMKEAIIVSAAVLLSGSAIGIALVAIIWLLWMLKYNKFQNWKYFIAAVAVVTTATVLVVNHSRVIQQLVYRVGTIGQSGSSTGSLRLLRGIAIYQQLPWTCKVFGVGLGNLEQFLIKYNISTIYDTVLEAGNEYMNTISFILVSTGAIGMVLYIAFVITIVIHSNRRFENLAIIIIWLSLCAVTSNYLNFMYALPLVLLFRNVRRENDKR